jgi:hypothetical protein
LLADNGDYRELMQAFEHDRDGLESDGRSS